MNNIVSNKRNEYMIIGIIFCAVILLFTLVMCKSAKMADEKMKKIIKGENNNEEHISNSR